MIMFPGQCVQTSYMHISTLVLASQNRFASQWYIIRVCLCMCSIIICKYQNRVCHIVTMMINLCEGSGGERTNIEMMVSGLPEAQYL